MCSGVSNRNELWFPLARGWFCIGGIRKNVVRFLPFVVSLSCLRPPTCETLSRSVSVVFFIWGGRWWNEWSECERNLWGSMGIGLFRILRSTNAKIYLQQANSNPLHQQLHLNQLSNRCSGFQGQESCRALGWFLCGNKCFCFHLGTLRGHSLQTAVGWGFVLGTVEQAPGGDGPFLGTWDLPGITAHICLERSQVHLGTDGQCLGIGSLGGSQQLYAVRAISRCVFPTAPLFSSLPYLCCAFLQRSFVNIFFFCLALLLAYFPPPPKSSLAASAAFHSRPRRWLKGSGLLPGKLPAELSAVAQPHPASFSLDGPIPLPDSMRPDHALLICCDPGLPPFVAGLS